MRERCGHDRFGGSSSDSWTGRPSSMLRWAATPMATDHRPSIDGDLGRAAGDDRVAEVLVLDEARPVVQALVGDAGVVDGVRLDLADAVRAAHADAHRAAGQQRLDLARRADHRQLLLVAAVASANMHRSSIARAPPG